ncbi:long-chain-fatty-acid--CoA ligase [Corynebacterium anserum]|uniref:AMP-binding protein n=1 Tax=Corynebacterium anserum TaxID=2684406 RepID=A0A7G7YQJ6_9CORY|nr:long-chain-fatty-acid--CoA ligase [Corynebacterium anserum]QNH96766.1 AMP-binding protein [Corynebacterium anserum]
MNHNTEPKTSNTASDAFNTKAWYQHYTPWTAHEIDLDDPATMDRGRTLVEIFHNATEEFADRDAFTFFGVGTTYRAYGAKVAITAAALRNIGVRRGDYVAIVAPNCPQSLISFYAVLSLGAIPALHNPLYTAAELKTPFNNHKAKVGLFWEKANSVGQELKKHTPLETIISLSIIDDLPTVKRLALSLPLPIPALQAAKAKLTGSTEGSIKFKDFIKGVKNNASNGGIKGGARGRKHTSKQGYGAQGFGDDIGREKIEPEDPALILYTSGTTGTPKGALLTHRNLISNVQMGRAWVEGLGEGGRREKMLAALPIFHAYGLTMNITLAPAVGGTIQLLPAPEMDLIMDIMKKDTPTWLPGVPTLYEKIMDEAEKQSVSLKGIRSSFSGASSLPAATVQRWEELTGGNIVEGYGLTETSPIIAGNPMGKGREGYIGVPFPSTEIRIANPDNPAETMPDGEAGELLVRGPQVFSGYLDMPEETQKAFYEDWFRTGDMAVMESDGYIKIVSRIKEMIITGGFNVYPAEVEAVLMQHDAVNQASVVGVDREDGSETVTAALVLAKGRELTEELIEELKEFSRKQLTRYKVPRSFEHFLELPADQLGKVRRGEVRDLVLRRLKKK